LGDTNNDSLQGDPGRRPATPLSWPDPHELINPLREATAVPKRLQAPTQRAAQRV